MTKLLGKLSASYLAAGALLFCTAGVVGAATPAASSAVQASNNATATHVDGSFNLACSFSGAPDSCEYTLDGSNWQPAALSSATVCSALPSCADGTALTLNMRATNADGTGTGSAISRTCDAQSPTTTDNAPAGWQSNDVTVTLTASDAGSGLQYLFNCQDTANTCTPNMAGGSPTNVSVTGSAGSLTQKYVRFLSRDNVYNSETVHTKLVQIDKQAPTGGSITYPNGNTKSPISVSFVNGSDGSGSGMGTRVIERAEATLSGNCGAFGAFGAISTNPASSPISDSVATKKCYQYRYLVQDAVGNLTTYTSPNIAKVK